MGIKVESRTDELKTVFKNKFVVDFYQREYVWEQEHIEELISDLSSAFLKNWSPDHKPKNVRDYDPYYMGEIVITDNSDSGSECAIIDGQQRITSLTLLLIFVYREYGKLDGFPSGFRELIYGDSYGEKLFNLNVEERNICMKSLLDTGEYTVKKGDTPSVENLVARFNDIKNCWNNNINETNACAFAYWLQEKVLFSTVKTNNKDFAYVIFETMNDRGLNLTPIEMLRSYLLAKIDDSQKIQARKRFDEILAWLADVKKVSKSKADFDFFKMYLRSQLAEDLNQKNKYSDFVMIGSDFNKWVQSKEKSLKLDTLDGANLFLEKLRYFSSVYVRVCKLIAERNFEDYLYLTINAEFGFTMQPALILASVNYEDSDDTVNRKIALISKYLTKVLVWRVWNHNDISQSSMEAPLYQLCKAIRGMTIEDISQYLKTDPIKLPDINASVPILNQANRRRLKVLLTLITALVAKGSKEPADAIRRNDLELEHIWANHFERHKDEFSSQDDFANTRNTIGDLVLLPKSFNSSYGDDIYEDKVVHYIEQNILVQSLCKQKYEANPGFLSFVENSSLPFKPYEHFTKVSIAERSELYRQILILNWPEAVMNLSDNSEQHKIPASMESLYRSIEKAIKETDPRIESIAMKYYIKFVLGNRIVASAVGSSDKIDVFFNTRDKQLEDDKGILDDMAGIGHHGIGKLRFRVKEKNQLSDLKNFLLQTLKMTKSS